MKTTALLLFIGVYALTALAQTLAPSPTESIGCVAHGDHWDCEGPRSTMPAASSPPPAVTPTSPAATTPAHDDDGDHAPGTGSLPPSPTASSGCIPHGDHWDCDTSAVTSGVLPTTSGSNTVVTAGAASDRVAGVALVLGLVVLAALGL